MKQITRNEQWNGNEDVVVGEIELFQAMSCLLVGLTSNKGKVPAGRQQQAGEEIAHAPPKLSLLCRDLVLLSLALTAAYNDPATERSTVPPPPLLPLASMQTLDAATFESRFQIQEQILFNRDDPQERRISLVINRPC